MEFYTTNKDFQRYVEKYCKEYNCTVEEALSHAIVIAVGEQYKEEMNKNE